MTTKVLQLLNSAILPALAVGSTVFGVVSGANADMVKIIAKPMCGKDLGHVVIAFYDGNNNVVTKAMWKTGVKDTIEPDQKMARGEDGGCFGLRTRTAYVTATRREWLQNAVASPGGTNFVTPT